VVVYLIECLAQLLQSSPHNINKKHFLLSIASDSSAHSFLSRRNPRHLIAKMFRSMLVRSSASAKQAVIRRSFSSGSVPERKVAILGAAGGIGQPLALLMKLNPLVSSLSLYDIANTPGVAADVGHINTRSEVLQTKSLFDLNCFLVQILNRDVSFWLIRLVTCSLY